jgi:multiple sugar transport system permease protein
MFRQDARWYLAFLLPALLMLVGITFGPFLYSIYLSFHSWTLTRPGPPTFVGFANYARMFNDGLFFGSVWTTAKMLLFCLAIQVPIGFGMALLLNRPHPLMQPIRTLILLPMMVTPIVAALMWQMMFNNEYGPVRFFLNGIGIQNVPIWLGDPSTALAAIVIVDSWQWTPMIMLFVLAGLQTIPSEYYEIAELEGAASLQILRNIIIPFVQPILVVVVLLRSIDIIKLFDVIFVLTRGGPGTATETMTYFAYRRGFAEFDMGYAATLALFILALVIFASTQAIRLFGNREGGQAR